MKTGHAGHGSKRGRLFLAGALAVAESGNLATAARKIGIHHTTLARWMQDPDFLEAVQEARRELLRGLVQRRLASTES